MRAFVVRQGEPTKEEIVFVASLFLLCVSTLNGGVLLINRPDHREICRWCGCEKAVHTERQWEAGKRFAKALPELRWVK